MIAVIIILGWLLCGGLAYAGAFAYFQRKFPDAADRNYCSDIVSSVFMGLFGPLGLLMVVLFFDFFKHGLKWR